MLWTHIEDQDCSLDNAVDRHHFISGCECDHFIEEQMRHERNVPIHQHEFQTDSLLITIDGHPELPSLPTKKAIHDSRVEDGGHFLIAFLIVVLFDPAQNQQEWTQK